MKQRIATLLLLFLSLSSNAAVHYQLAHFSQLPGWQQGTQKQALHAFIHSCYPLLHYNNSHQFSNHYLPIPARAWHSSCRQALRLRHANNQQARAFFLKQFVPVAVSSGRRHWGLFTGYYVPVIAASKQRSNTYHVPIYALPHHRIALHLTRAAINNGKLKGHARVLVWAKSRIDRYFMQIQGSGIAVLRDGKRLALGYAGTNGLPFTAIGRLLLHKGLIKIENTSLEKVKTWLAQHPSLGHKLMDKNRSFIFSRILPHPHPIGAHDIMLTPMRSLAVDPRFIPFGAPIWLDSSLPKPKHQRFRHLVIAQDTGSAIVGAIRGDLFIGTGQQAGLLAGHLSNRGRYWVLLPKAWAKGFLARHKA